MTRNSPRDTTTLDRRTFLAGLGATAAAGVTGYGVGASDGDDWRRAEPPTPSGTYVESTTETASGPNFVQHDDEATRARIDVMFDRGGGRFGPDTLDPRWIEGWTINDSYDRVEYRLRDGLEWGAGYGQLDAEDYLYFLENLALLTGADDWYLYDDTPRFELGADDELVSFEKTGSLTFEAELPVSKPEWFHEDPVLDLIPVPKALLKPYVQNQDKEGLDGDADLTEGRLSKGNLGPYEFVRWERGTRWVFTRNDDYYLTEYADEEPFASDPYYDLRNAPYYERYEVEVFDDESDALSALESGEVQRAPVGTQKASAFKRADGIDVFERPFDDFVGWLNMNHRINGWAPIRESTQVRRAMTNLYDRETVVEEAYDGYARPTATYHPEWGPYYPDADALYEPDGTVARAKELLAEGTSSDYGYDENDRFVGPDGTQVTLTAARTTGNRAVERATEYLRSRLDAAGIELEVDAQTFFSLLGDYAINSVDNVDGVDEPDWEVSQFNGGPWDQSASKKDWTFILGLGFDTAPFAPWDDLQSTMAEKGTFNLWGYSQDEYDVTEVTEAAATAADPDAARETTADLLGFLSREVPLAWTETGVTTTAYRDNVENHPGDETEWGYEATDYFTESDTARLTWYDEDASGPRPTPRLSLDVDRGRIGPDGTVSADVVLSGAPNGLAGFELDLAVAAPEVAAITDATVPDRFGLGETAVADDGDSVTLKASDLDENVEPGATGVTLATVVFAAENAGSTDLTISVTAVDDDTGAAVRPETATGTLTVTPVERIGDNPLPTDPDDDGDYEDLNGNGRLDFDDVVLFFQYKDSDEIGDNVDAYDFNDNGRIDFDDVNELFEET